MIQIETYNADEGAVNGRPVHRGNYATIHDACVSLVVPEAQRTAQPVLAHAVDLTNGDHQEFWIKIHPTGDVTAAHPPADAPVRGDSDEAVVHEAHSGRRRRREEAQPRGGNLRRSDYDLPEEHHEPDYHLVEPEISSAPTTLDVLVEPVVPPAPRVDSSFDAGDTDSYPDLPSQISAFVPSPVPGPPSRPVDVPVASQSAWPAPNPSPAPQYAAESPAPQTHAHAGGFDQRPVEQQYVPPTLNDLLANRPEPPAGPATTGWRALLAQLTGGLIKLPAGGHELSQRGAVGAVQRSLSGPKTVVIINPKGGADKTTATLLIAATFGIHRGGYTLAWDNNETRGTMGWRANQGRHTNTAVDLLRELDRFEDPRSARVGDLDNFVRSQGSAQFDVLASDEDAVSAASIDAEAFSALHRSLARFYRVIVVDTGNNMRASNWQAAVDAADQLVIVSTIREDTGQSAAWVADALNATEHRAKVRNAVTVLAAPSARPDQALAQRLRAHFSGLTRAVVDVPFDPSLVAGGPINIDALSAASREAWLHVTALVADGL